MRKSVKHLIADIELHGEYLVFVVLQIGGQSVLVDPDLLGLSHVIKVSWKLCWFREFIHAWEILVSWRLVP